MHFWLAITRLLTAMETVQRVWARECGVDAREISILILLASRRLATSDLAYETGRHRQHVHRSLLELESRGYVEPARVSVGGKTLEWMLTAGGAVVAERFLIRTRTWEQELLSRHVELARFIDDAEILTRGLVNYPTAESWREGLTVPRPVRLDPLWDQPALLDAATKGLPPEAVSRPAMPRKKPRRAPRAPKLRSSIDPRTEEDYAELDALWFNLVRR